MSLSPEMGAPLSSNAVSNVSSSEIMSSIDSLIESLDPGDCTNYSLNQALSSAALPTSSVLLESRPDGCQAQALCWAPFSLRSIRLPTPGPPSGCQPPPCPLMGKH